LLRVATEREAVIAVRLPVDHQPPDVPGLRQQRGGRAHARSVKVTRLQPVGIEAPVLSVVQIVAIQERDRFTGGGVGANVAKRLIRDWEGEPVEARELTYEEHEDPLRIAG